MLCNNESVRRCSRVSNRSVCRIRSCNSLMRLCAGYGHATPQTIGGKIFCMFYAVTGIPLCIVMFQSVGERLNIFLTFILQQGKKCLKRKDLEVSQSNLLLITLNVSTFILATGAAIFAQYEVRKGVNRHNLFLSYEPSGHESLTNGRNV